MKLFSIKIQENNRQFIYIRGAALVIFIIPICKSNNSRLKSPHLALSLSLAKLSSAE